jgi:hypothetical protein
MDEWRAKEEKFRQLCYICGKVFMDKVTFLSHRHDGIEPVEGGK